MSADGSIDSSQYRTILDRCMLADIRGVAPGSTTGEFPYLSTEERRNLLELTVDHVGGEVDVVASASSASTREAVDYCRHAEEVGASAVLANLMIYFPLTEAQIIKHFQTVAAATRLPIVLYNQPLSGVDLTPRMIHKLSQTPNIMGVKESSPDVSRIAAVRELSGPEFTIYCGHGSTILPAFLFGAQGWYTALANFDARLCVELVAAAVAGDWVNAARLYERLAPLASAVYGRPLAPALKSALNLMGVPVGDPRSPLEPLSEPDVGLVGQLLEEFGAGLPETQRTNA